MHHPVKARMGRADASTAPTGMRRSRVQA